MDIRKGLMHRCFLFAFHYLGACRDRQESLWRSYK